MKISDTEKGIIVNFLNQDGYVLDFTTTGFNAFTLKSIGIPLCEKYKSSKGKSLISYIHEADEKNAIKLLCDLIKHYEQSQQKENDEKYNKDLFSAYLKCRNLINRVCNTAHITTITEDLKKKFDSDYISDQINLMVKIKDENPTEAIGKAKELIESCCKTILELEKCTINKDWNIIRLVDETMKHFNLMPKDIPNDIKGVTAIKAILGNLKAIAQGMAELRNLYGSGHGKTNSYKGLEPRHANLAIGSCTTLVLFLWNSYERSHKQFEQ